MSSKSDIALYGAYGQIGSILREHWGERVVPVGEWDSPRFPDTVVWCATQKPEHSNLGIYVKDTENFLLTLFRCEVNGVRRVVYTSSFGIETDDARTVPLNAYAAGKIAGEAFTEAWQRLGEGRSACVIRMGGYGPLTPAGAWYEMTPEQICAVYDEAIATTGFKLLSPTRAKRPKEGASE